MISLPQVVFSAKYSSVSNETRAFFVERFATFEALQTGSVPLEVRGYFENKLVSNFARAPRTNSGSSYT